MRQKKLKVSTRKVNRIDAAVTDSVAWGPEPTWPPSTLLETASQRKMRLGFAFDWYSYRSDANDQKTWFLQYLSSQNYPSAVSERFTNLPAESFAPAGSLVRCATRGAKIENLQRYISDYVTRFNDLHSLLVTRQVIKVKSVRVVKQDPRIGKCIVQINEILDVFITKLKPFLVTAEDILTLNDASPNVVKSVKHHFLGLQTELTAVLQKTDPELTEAYSNYSRQQITKMNDFLDTINSYEPEIQDIVPEVVKTRKPRKKKVKTSGQILKKFKYKGSSTELKGLSSVQPSTFLGQQQLVIYHEDKRIIGVFYAADSKGLTVSGSSIRDMMRKNHSPRQFENLMKLFLN
jgi:hypothetical protein